MAEQKFNIQNVEQINADLDELKELIDTIDDLFCRIISPIEGDDFSKLSTSKINLCVYELRRDKGKVLSLIDVIRAMLVKNYSNLGNEVSNYYEDKSNDKKINKTYAIECHGIGTLQEYVDEFVKHKKVVSVSVTVTEGPSDFLALIVYREKKNG